MAPGLEFNYQYPASPVGRELVETLVSVPRKIPPFIREELASFLVMELADGKAVQIGDLSKFSERYGIFYPLLIHLHHTELWNSIKELGKDSPETAAPINQLFISKVFDLIDQWSLTDDTQWSDIDRMISALIELCNIDPDSAKNRGSDFKAILSEKISQFIAQFKEILSLLPPEESDDSIHLKKIRDLSLELIEKLETNLSNIQENIGFLDFDEIPDLTDALMEAIHQYDEEIKSYKGGSLSKPPDDVIKPEDINTGDGEETAGESRMGGADQNGGCDPASLLHKGKSLLQDFHSQVDKFQAQKRSDSSGNQLQNVVQQSVFDPVYSQIKSLQSHRNSIRYLAQIFPGKDWGQDFTSLKQGDISNLEKIAQCSEKSLDLKNIIKKIGRIRTDFGVKSSPLSPMGRSDIYSISRSGDLSRLLPAETALLRRPVFRKKFYADFIEGKLMTYQLQGKNWADGKPKKKKKGSVVALIDTSGSMYGFPELVAKSIILSLSRIMSNQERDVKIILFSGPGNIHEIELTSGKKMQSEFMSFMEKTFGGGTDFNSALKSGLTSLQQPEFKGADLLFITDGISEITNRGFIREWIKTKETQNARIYSFIIDSSDAGGLSQISDYTYFIQNDMGYDGAGNEIPVIRFVPSPSNPNEKER